jgi:hypothetical protein
MIRKWRKSESKDTNITYAIANLYSCTENTQRLHLSRQGKIIMLENIKCHGEESVRDFYLLPPSKFRRRQWGRIQPRSCHISIVGTNDTRLLSVFQSTSIFFLTTLILKINIDIVFFKNDLWFWIVVQFRNFDASNVDVVVAKQTTRI